MRLTTRLSQRKYSVGLLAATLALAGVTLGSGAQAATSEGLDCQTDAHNTFSLTARDGYVSTPDGNSLYMSVTTIQPTGSRPRLLLNLVLTALLVLVASYAYLLPRPTPKPATTVVPESTALEATTGVRFSRVAVVGDKGLVTLFYVVLDPEKATAFQADRAHPPRLSSESRHGGTRRASIMSACIPSI